MPPLRKSSSTTVASSASSASSMGSLASSASTNSSRSSSDSSSNDGEKTPAQIAACVRNVANFSHVKPFHLLDKKNFNPELLSYYLEQAAPKLVSLFEKIEALDAADMKKEGKVFKHMIFTDNKSSSYGAKIIASAFISKGYNPTFHVQGTGFTLHPESKLMESKGKNFSLLMSKTVYDRPMNVKFKKTVLEMYNSRPENIQGDLVRFIILDQGFKEGIDLFDVKYVHLFEPLVVKADEKQAIGRGTRFCGQRGLEFHPRFGWPLYVFRYEVSISPKSRPELRGAKQMFELYLKYADIDLRKVVFAAELENAAVEASVDKELTQAVHNFSIEKPAPILQQGGIVLRSNVPTPPSKIYNSLSNMRAHINKGFKLFTYPKVKLENQCKDMTGGVKPQLVQFTPTQDFIRHYFQPESAYKGMLLFHSVGTGKTCSAIATASTSFEKEGYTILWVTRHTLKSDIWKNMFQWVCSMTVQEKLKDGSLKLPANLGNPKRFAPPEWMEPISYKQFSNMLLKKNNIYNEIVKRNGAKDPLHKTLIIIDEAHKLYSSTVVGSEKPRTDILEEMIQNSYKVSGKDSARVLLMTATPYTEDGMEMIKLLNLLREKNPLPADFDDFSKKYLDDQGFFKQKTLKEFQDDISGYISYLNRSQDARNFAHPVLEDVFVELTEEAEEPEPVLNSKGKPIKEKIVGKYEKWMKEIRENMKNKKVFIKDAKSDYKECIKEQKGNVKLQKLKIAAKIKEEIEQIKDDRKDELEECKEKPVKERKVCREEIKEKYNTIIAEKKSEKKDIIQQNKNEGCIEPMNDLNELLSELQEIKDEQLQVKGYQEAIRTQLKELSKESEKLREIYEEDKPKYKKLQRSNKAESKKIRAIKDKVKRIEAMRKYRTTNLKDLKEFKNKIIAMKARLSAIREARKLIRLQLGKIKLTKISQKLALEKRCKI